LFSNFSFSLSPIFLDPHNRSYVITLMSSVTSHTAHSERPERSRNAKAQARHRAKRKAYIDQLEQTVTKLQIVVGYTTEQVSALPPPLVKIRDLEQDNARLQKENEELRRLLQPDSRSDASRRTGVATYTPDPRTTCDREYNLKRRKAQDGVYISPGDTPPQGTEASIRPPPLNIPHHVSHHYGSMSSTSASHHGGSNGTALFNLQGPTFQMPNTPSGSSANSSPPFSPIQIQAATHLDHGSHISNHSMSTYPQHNYSTVKVEDDHYTSNHPSHHSSMHYSYSGQNNMDWQTAAYSSERQHLHR